MKNGIVCSIVAKDNDYLQNIYLYKQLSYSIKTLREFNKDIPVIVYISAKHKRNDHETFFPYENVHFIEFENKISDGWYPTFLDGTYAEVIEHRWINAFRGLEEFNFDNIIYMDTDTQFFKDPELLFEKYGNTEFIWTREDVCIEEMDILGITPGMNDGITVISKNILKHKDACLEHIRNYINTTLNDYATIMTPAQHYHLNWIIIQYAAFDYFNPKGLHRYYDPKHVKLHMEVSLQDLSETIMHHYFTGNSHIFLPKEYNWHIDPNTHERVF